MKCLHIGLLLIFVSAILISGCGTGIGTKSALNATMGTDSVSDIAEVMDCGRDIDYNEYGEEVDGEHRPTVTIEVSVYCLTRYIESKQPIEVSEPTETEEPETTE